MASDREEERLDALARYAILDTSPEQAFDDVAKLAAALCDTPIALVSLVDRDRQWFKAVVGLDLTETPRAISFCSHAIEGEGPFIVEDASGDERFANNPLVTGALSLRFFAGVPLVEEHDGLALGTLCVLDTRPRGLTELQLRTLRVLSKQVVAQLEVRKLLAHRAQRRRGHRRDPRGPLAAHHVVRLDRLERLCLGDGAHGEQPEPEPEAVDVVDGAHALEADRSRHREGSEGSEGCRCFSCDE